MHGLSSQRGLLNILLVIRSWTTFNKELESREDENVGSETGWFYRNEPVLELMSNQLAFLPDSQFYIIPDAYFFTGVGIYRTQFRISTGTMVDYRLLTGLIVPMQRWLDALSSEPQSETIRAERMILTETVSEVPFSSILSKPTDRQDSRGSKKFIERIVARSVVVPFREILDNLYDVCSRGRFRDPAPLRVLTSSTTNPDISNVILLEDTHLGEDGRYMNNIPGIREIRDGLTNHLPIKVRSNLVLSGAKGRVGQIAYDFTRTGYPALRGLLEGSP